MSPITAEELESLQPWFTVVGVWPETKERYAQPYAAQTPRQAEEFAQMDAKEKGGELWVCGVVEGQIKMVDTYATFVDPDKTTQAGY